jgi:DNA-binding NarL/FixJ family response regulator
MTAKKKNDPAAGLTFGLGLGGHQAEEDIKRSLREINVEACTVDIGAIRPRHEQVPGRRIVGAHALKLAESLVNETLVTACTVDNQRRLIAGAHRLTAALLLYTPPAQRKEVWVQWIGRDPGGKELERLEALPYQPERWRQIPVRVLVDLDSAEDPAAAIAAMAAENTVRRNMGAEEIKKTIEDLVRAGYRSGTGRPKKGVVPLRVALQHSLGISAVHAKRLLGEYRQKTPAPETQTTIKRQISRAAKIIEALEKTCQQSAQPLPQTLLLIDRLLDDLDVLRGVAMEELSEGTDTP